MNIHLGHLEHGLEAAWVGDVFQEAVGDDLPGESKAVAAPSTGDGAAAVGDEGAPNRLFKILDDQNYQNAGNVILEYATSTRDFERAEQHAVDIGLLAHTSPYITVEARWDSRQTLGGTPTQVRKARPNEFGSSKPSKYAASFNSNAEFER